MLNEGEVYFCLFGDGFDPGSISEEIGIEPTRIKHKGVPIPKQSSWIYSTGKIKHEIIDVYQMASSVVSALASYAENIRRVKERYALDAVLEVVLTVTPDDSISTPAIGFDLDVIDFLHKVGATIDIDTYRGES